MNEKQKEYYRKYRATHKESINRNNRKYAAKNREKIYQKSEKYRKKYFEKIKEYKAKWAKDNKWRGVIYRKKNKKNKQDYIISYKLNKTCAHCTENRPECLDFHHLKDKISTVSKLFLQAASLEKLKKEIDKCILLCGNCHQKNHFKCYKTTASRKQYIIEYKSKSKCYLCPENTPCCLAFHHLDEKSKIAGIDVIASRKGYTFDDLKIEIQKCILLCFNCHRLLHANKLSLPDNVEPIKLDNY